MVILGLNAFHPDAGAALVADGRLIAAAEEERFCRVKHWAGLPTEAVRACLNQAGIGPEAIDAIAVNRKPSAHLWRKTAHALANPPGFRAVRERIMNAANVRDLRQALAQTLGLPRGRLTAPLHHIEHHRAHLASAFLVSPFERAAVLSLDGFGDFLSSMRGHGQGPQIQVLDQVRFPHSLGLFYLAMTQYLGFPCYGDEYKVMGLAAYGRPSHLGSLRHMIRLKPRGGFELDLRYFNHHPEGMSMSWKSGAPVIGRVFTEQLVKLLGPARGSEEPAGDRHADLAASVQALYEEVFCHVLNDLHSRTKETSLCLAGGCIQNSVANGRIAERTPFEQFYVPPAVGDAGGAIGAAYALWHDEPAHRRSFVMDRVDWGPEYAEREIAAAIRARVPELERAGCRTEILHDEEKRCRRTAKEIADGKVVGWFQGRMEWGPRALGHRSILADPRRPEMKDLLNARIKRREWFRPFAPSVIEEAAGDYFEGHGPSPFMEMTCRVNAAKRSVIPATTHADGSARLQTVNRTTQPLYWRLIKEFGELTGIPVILNTSFNENEPIVRAPEEAIDCFLRSGMETLVIGESIITRGLP